MKLFYNMHIYFYASKISTWVLTLFESLYMHKMHFNLFLGVCIWMFIFWQVIHAIHQVFEILLAVLSSSDLCLLCYCFSFPLPQQHQTWGSQQHIWQDYKKPFHVDKLVSELHFFGGKIYNCTTCGKWLKDLKGPDAPFRGSNKNE